MDPKPESSNQKSSIKASLRRLKRQLGLSKYPTRALILVIILISLPLTLILVRYGIELFLKAQVATVNVSFSPDTAELNNGQTQVFSIFLNSGTNPIGYARVTFSYDNSKVQLAQEINTNVSPLYLNMNNSEAELDPLYSAPLYACTLTTPCIIKTPMAAANTAGQGYFVVGLHPNDRGSEPTSTFKLAEVTFQAVTGSNTTTTVDFVVSDMQIVDTNGVEFINAGITTTSATITLNPTGPTPTTGANIISNLVPNDGQTWNIMSNLQSESNGGDLQYSDRGWDFASVDPNVAGADWIQTANASKNSTVNPTFDISVDSIVYVAHDDRITTKPDWIRLDPEWTDSTWDLVNNEATNEDFSLYGKHFTAGQTGPDVTLGPNDSGGNGMYTVVVVPDAVIPTPTPTDQLTPTPTPTGTTACNTCYNFNGLGDIDVGDIAYVANIWGAVTGDPFYNEQYDVFCPSGSIDGVINVADIAIVANIWGQPSCQP